MYRNKTRAELFSILVASLLALVIQGCGYYGKTVVIKPITTPVAHSAKMALSEGETANTIPPEINSSFKSKLEALMYQDAGFSKGASGVTVQYKILEYSPGNQFYRWLCGKCGEGKLLAEAKFVDPSGGLISTIQREGVIQSGFLGGFFYNAIDETAGGIMEYAKTNFQ